MAFFKWLNLQLFADGTGAAGEGGEGASTGENGSAAAEQRLLELGVPADKIRKRAKYAVKKAEPAEQSALPQEQPEAQAKEQVAAAEEVPTEEKPKPTWEELMADPDYNGKMQEVVKARLRETKASEEAMKKLMPALEVLARKHGLDPENLDYDALNKAISDDNSMYEEKALEMGVSVETAKRMDQLERDSARAQREQERTLEQQKIQQHIQKLEQQGEALKKVFPKFDLRKELQNPAFARMTAPNIGISVEDAYYAVHRNEIQAAAMQVTAQETAKKISNSIQSGQRRPVENGVSGQAASVTTFDYRSASREQREAIKRQIREAAARGEKVYPGQR